MIFGMGIEDIVEIGVMGVRVSGWGGLGNEVGFNVNSWVCGVREGGGGGIGDNV